jgi:hypothetical protein
MAELGVKRCSECGKTGPLDAFPPNSRTRNGLSSWCRECHNEAVREWRERNPGYYVSRRVKYEPRPMRPVRPTVRPATFRHAALLEPVPMALGAPPAECRGVSLGCGNKNPRLP